MTWNVHLISLIYTVKKTKTDVKLNNKRLNSGFPPSTSYLCLGTMKSARTSFLLLAFVFIFMQKSMAAYKQKSQYNTSP